MNSEVTFSFLLPKPVLDQLINSLQNPKTVVMTYHDSNFVASVIDNGRVVSQHVNPKSRVAWGEANLHK